MAEVGRPGPPREVRVAFWDGVRAGLGVEAAGAAAGIGRRAAWKWVRQAGGVKQNGPAAVPGRFLQGWEREEIAVGLARELPLREIARRLGRSASTVSREVRRNSVRGACRAHLAAREAQQRASRPKPAKLTVNGELRAWVEGKLEKNWSPEEISARLRPDFPGRAEMRVSAETVYQSLYVQGRGGCAGSWRRTCGPGGSCAGRGRPRASGGGRSRAW